MLPARSSAFTHLAPHWELKLQKQLLLQKSGLILHQAFLPNFGGVIQYILLSLFALSLVVWGKRVSRFRFGKTQPKTRKIEACFYVPSHIPYFPCCIYWFHFLSAKPQK